MTFVLEFRGNSPTLDPKSRGRTRRKRSKEEEKEEKEEEEEEEEEPVNNNIYVARVYMKTYQITNK